MTLTEPRHPIDLGVFRIVVFAVVLASPDVHGAAAFAGLPAAWQQPPVGASLLPGVVSPLAAQVAHVVLVLASVCGLIGLRARAAALVAALAGTYLLGIPQLYGTVRHYHHLVWFLALLAASPCGDALSLDRVLAVRAGRAPGELPPSRATGVSLSVAWLLVSAIYFFPGVWKLVTSGLDWAWSDNLVRQMHWKWAQAGGWTPAWRVDQYPFLCRLAATGVLAFELAFPLLALYRPLRTPLLLAAVAFHLLADAFLLIPFQSLWLCYVGLFDWAPLLAPLEARLLARMARPGVPPPPRSPWPTGVVGVLLLAGVVAAGATRTVAGWPFACYPTFDQRVGAGMPALDIDVTDAQGRTRTLDLRPPRGVDSQRHWGLQWRLVLDQQPARRDRGLRAYWRDLQARHPALADVRQVRLYRTWLDTEPGRVGRRLRRNLLLRLDLAMMPGSP